MIDLSLPIPSTPKSVFYQQLLLLDLKDFNPLTLFRSHLILFIFKSKCVLFIFQLPLSLIYFSSYLSFFWKALYNPESFLRVKLHSYPFQFSTFSSSSLFLGSHRFENWKRLCYLEGIHFLLYFSHVKVHLLIFRCHPQFKSILFSSLATTNPDNTLFLFHLLLIVSQYCLSPVRAFVLRQSQTCWQG